MQRSVIGSVQLEMPHEAATAKLIRRRTLCTSVVAEAGEMGCAASAGGIEKPAELRELLRRSTGFDQSVGVC